MRTYWTIKGNRDAGSSYLCDRGLHRYLRNFGGEVWTPQPPQPGTPLPQGPAGQSRPSPEMTESTKRVALGNDQPSAFRLPWLRFSVNFLTCKANATINDAKSGHGPHSLDPGASSSTKRLEKVAHPEIPTEPVWAPNTDSQPNKSYPSLN